MNYSKDIVGWLISDDCLNTAQDDDTQHLLDELVAKIEQAGLRYEYEERASILEYEGKMSRYDADRVAAIEIMERLAGNKAKN